MIAGTEPEQRWREPETLDARIIICYVAQIARGGQDAARADKTFDLKNERVKRGKINNTQGAQKYPARQHMSARSFGRGFRPQQPFSGVCDTRQHIRSGGL